MKQGIKTDWTPYLEAFNFQDAKSLCQWAIKKTRGYEKAAKLLSQVKPISSKPIRNLLRKRDYTSYKEKSRLQLRKEQTPKNWPYKCKICGQPCPWPRRYTCNESHMDKLVRVYGYLENDNCELRL